MAKEPSNERREAFPHLLEIQTRWHDNDAYGHVNNTVYYAYFDTVINRYLVDRGGLDIAHGEVIGLCVESNCRYFDSLAFPQAVQAGLRVSKLGNSSVRYEIGIFRAGRDEPCALGHFVHVFVERKSQKPTPIAGRMREALSALLIRSE